MENRCPWPKNDNLMIKYHDTEWGVPLHEDKKLFEFMVLDAFQAGLSWQIVLKKRDGFKKAFVNYNLKKVSNFDEDQIQKLLYDESIIRNRLKIESTVENAKAFIRVQKEFGSFDKYIWQFVSYKPKVNKWHKLNEIPVSSAESDNMSKDLKKRGFKFVGSTICYSFMQAAGMINDHLVTCPRYKDVEDII
jgi:DNA-3-methyladenine glycosylase I